MGGGMTTNEILAVYVMLMALLWLVLYVVEQRQQQTPETDPYVVVTEQEECEACGWGRMWAVKYAPTDERVGESFYYEGLAKQFANDLNTAYQRGKEAA
jgi:hypothetical protein